MNKEELETKTSDEVLLVDIREIDELLLVPSLAAAVHIPMSDLIKEAQTGRLPKDRTIVTVCRSGRRCHFANQILRQHCYTVDMLEGGMNEYDSR